MLPFGPSTRRICQLAVDLTDNGDYGNVLTMPMSATHIETEDLRLLPQTREDLRTYVEQMQRSERAALSAAWKALLDGSSPADPWIHGFIIVNRQNGGVVGRCGFKGPPDGDGVVEIAYGVHPEHERKGYATQAAGALVGYAFKHKQVRQVRAHTLPQAKASTRVLTKCGFQFVGEVIDPEDGLVWRWQINNAAAEDASSAKA